MCIILYVCTFICSVSTGVKNPVLKRPSMEQRLAHRINTPCPQSMYIMADLRHTVDGSVRNSHYNMHVHVHIIQIRLHVFPCIYT